MGRFIDLTGQRSGRLIVVRQAGRDKWKNILWSCLCDCGNTTTVLGGAIRKGRIQSCGCTKIQHGHSKKGEMTQIYSTWTAMRQRCNNLKHPEYKNYGKRGIVVCKRWEKFENFLEDMGEPPTDKHSIDRIDNDGNYCKSNCRWATLKQQQRNKRNNLFITYDGKTQCLAAWAEEFDIKYGTLESRLRRGWSIGKALTTPVKKSKRSKK